MASARCSNCGAATSTSGNTEELCSRCRRETGEDVTSVRLSPPRPNLVELTKALAAAKGWTQTELAARLGVTQPTVSKIIAGQRFPGPDVELRMATLLGLGQDEAGLIRPTSALLSPDDLMRIGRIVRLTESLRNHGAAEIALPELRPTMKELIQAQRAGQDDPAFALLLIDALLAYAVTLGDLSAEEDSPRVIATADEAVTLSRRHSNAVGLAHALNTLGNQQRVGRRLADAKKSVTEAASLESGILAKGASASWLARISSESGDHATFDQAIRDARLALDRLRRYTSLVNPLSVGEIEIRGLLKLGDGATAIRRLESLDVVGREEVAPQWRIIFAITAAEALIANGDLAGGITQLADAAQSATDQYMPHQLQRIARALQGIRSDEAADLKRDVRTRIQEPNKFKTK